MTTQLEGNEDWVYNAAFSHDGLAIATASQRGAVRLWDADTGAALGGVLENAGQAVAFSPDNSKIATAGPVIRIWDRASRKQLLEFQGSPAATGITLLSYDPAGRRLLTAGANDHLARIWDASTGVLLATLAGHTSVLMAAEFSPDGKWVVTAGFDQTARIWDAGTGDLLRIIRGPVHAADFSPDGTRLATGIGGLVVLWNLTLDERSVEDLAAYVSAVSPWKLVDGRLVDRSHADTSPAH